MKILNFGIVFIFLAIYANSQSFVVSPYSRYGLGELQTSTEPISFAMGGISCGFRNSNAVNHYNPASYTAIIHDKDSIPMVFNGGFKGNYSILRNESKSSQRFSGALNSMSFAFKAAKHWALAFGLQPYSSVGYKLVSKSIIDTVNYEAIYEGSGGFNKVWIGNSVEFLKNLNIGFNASYIFGSLNLTRTLKFDAQNYFNSKTVASRYVGDFTFDAGMQYDILLKKDTTITKNHTRLTIGFIAGLPSKLRAEEDIVAYRLYKTTASSLLTLEDTISAKEGIKGNISIPLSLGGGFIFSKDNNWSFGADYKTQFWSEYESFGVNDSLKNNTSINIGFSYKPLPKIRSKFSNRIIWYGGFHYDRTYLSLNGEDIVKFGINFGCTFPLRAMFSRIESTMLTTGVEIGKMGKASKNLVEENYIRFVVGVAIKERWFEKKKYY